MRIKDMAVLDQSVLINVGRELSYRRRRGSETSAVLRSSKRLRRGGCPGFGGDRFAMVLANEDAERTNFVLEMSDKAGVEIEEADEGM